MVSLSSCVTWITQVCSVSAHRKSKRVIETSWCVAENSAGQDGVLTWFWEPRGGSVWVYGAKPDHLIQLVSFADRHADQGVRLLRDHQHLKDLQWTRQREVDGLQSHGYQRQLRLLGSKITYNEGIKEELGLTLMSMNFCIDSTHSNSMTLDWKAPHRYLWPVYGLRTAGI